MAGEIAVLNRIHGRLPVPVPNPTFNARSDDGVRALFMGYRLIPGRALDRGTLDDLWAKDRASFDGLGEQLGRFLRALHAIDLAGLEERLPRADDVAHWSRMLDVFRGELFTYMRADARAAVELEFQTHLNSDVDWQPVLRHGDFGGANLQYDDSTRQLSGVIDFGAVAIGDPAVDLAAVTATDTRLAQAMQPAYPELFAPGALRRERFYRSTFALQQALWALRSGDDHEFNDGIAAYI
jgi:aminoglycoside 2''-phosphotransferase